MTTSAIIRCTDLTKRFGDVTAVDALNLHLEPGTVLGFIGPNGAGKSTTIRMMLGLSHPTSGTVRLFGHDPLRDHAVRRLVGYSPGELRLDERMTVETTLRSWGKLRGGVDEAYRDELIDRLGVRTAKHVRSLSTGNRRKVALVGALMSRPELLVLDEPTNGLDPLVQSEVMAILAEAKARGTSVLLSSHILSEVERIADQVVVIRAGEVVAEGPTDELRRSTTQEFRVTFADPVPDVTVFSGLDGVRAVEAVGPGSFVVHWSGPPARLLALLSGFDVESLTAPEPDLETAFMSYYRGDTPAQDEEVAS